MERLEKKYEYLFPPPHIFYDENIATYGWDKQEDGHYDKVRIEFPEEGGILYYPEAHLSPYQGFFFSPAINATAFFKRFLLLKIKSFKNPLTFLLIGQMKRELKELVYVEYRRYFLKPQYYCTPLRELYRVLSLVITDEILVHIPCAVLQWDNAYRFRVQNAIMRLSKKELRTNPRREINLMFMLGSFFEKKTDSNPQKSKWKAVWLVFNLAWMLSPSFRRKVKVVAREINIDKFLILKSDIPYAFV